MLYYLYQIWPSQELLMLNVEKIETPINNLTIKNINISNLPTKVSFLQKRKKKRIFKQKNCVSLFSFISVWYVGLLLIH